MSVINFYSFPIELKPKIAKIQICERVKVTEIIFSLGEIIIFAIFTVYISLINLTISSKSIQENRSIEIHISHCLYRDMYSHIR